jgi:dihydroorotate dehydrogenase
LQGVNYLDQLLGTVQTHARQLAAHHKIKPRPILIKLSPDLTAAEIDSVLECSLKHGVVGIIATNTTMLKEGLSSQNRHEQGGLSGRPLARRSSEMLAYIHRQVHDQLTLIGVGGVFSGADVKEKVANGAALVQLYTGLVYEGPSVAGRILRSLAA